VRVHPTVRPRLAAAAIALATLGLTAQSPSTLPAHAVATIDAAVEAERARQKIPGLTVAAAFRNTLIYSKAYGTADLEHAVPAKTTTAFRTASVAKPLTATGVMALVEAGRIELDAPIRTYCPTWPEKQPAITVRQVMAHLAGIRHYGKPGESAGKTHYFVLADAIALFKNDPLLHEPGAKYLYSTYGYSLLGCAIEGVSGTSYELFMRDRVFTKAGMTGTRLDRIYEIIPDRARGYQVLTQAVFDSLPPAVRTFAKAGEVYNADLHDTSMKVPGGGLVSTAEDLVRFGIALNTGKLLGTPALEMMWTMQTTSDGKDTGYGLGWGVQPPQDGIRKLSHSGNQAGASSLLVILPEVGVTYAIMTNLEDAELGTLSRGIANTLRDTLMPKK
jgi:CubicO group peptidase (beta-lactamase class C family)